MKKKIVITLILTFLITSNHSAANRRNDYDLLARVITAEVGYASMYKSEKTYKRACLLTGAVVINRMHSKDFPNTLQKVIYQKGQYACVTDGHIKRRYDPIAYKTAKRLLKKGVGKMPKDLIWQAGFKQGVVYEKIGETYFGRKI